MAKHRDHILIAGCVVVGLALVCVHGHHPGFGPLGWANTGGRTVSIGFMALMIELQFRRIVAAAGTTVTIS